MGGKGVVGAPKHTRTQIYACASVQTNKHEEKKISRIILVSIY